VFALREDGHHFAVDLNACRRVTSLPDAQRLSCAILLLRDGVRAILRARRITHG
jgi:hypothetical protein